MSIFYGKSDSLMGVDISSTGIKLVELDKARDGYELKSMAVVPLPRDVVVENTVIDSMAVTQGLLDAIELAQPSTRNVALVVSGNSVIIRTVTMPTMTEFELETQIEFEADQYIPYDIDDVYLDFQILGPVEGDESLMEVVLAACKREVVEDYQLVLNEAGLTPKVVDCAVFALENASELLEDEIGLMDAPAALSPEEGIQAYALVNVGANFININILQNGQMAFVRDQFYGGNNLTEEIQKAHGLAYQAAEQLKLENPSSIKAEALERFYERLTSELMRSLDFYAASHANAPVQKLFLSGGTALLPGIADELERRLGIEAKVLNPFAAIKADEGRFDRDYLERIGPMMMVPVGLALRSFDA